MDIINEYFINTNFYLTQNKYDNENDFISINSEIDLGDICFVIKELMIRLVDYFFVDFILKCPFDSESKEINLKEVKLITLRQLCEIKENSYIELDKFNSSRNIIRSYMDMKLDNLRIIKPFENHLNDNVDNIIKSKIRNTNDDNNNKYDNNVNNDKSYNNIEKDFDINVKKERKRSKKFKNNNNEKINLSNNISYYYEYKNKNNNDISNSKVNDNNEDIENNNHLSSYERQNSHKFENDYCSDFNKQNLSHQKNDEAKRKNNLNKIINDTPVTADKDSFNNENKNRIITNSNVKRLDYEEPSIEISNLK